MQLKIKFFARCESLSEKLNFQLHEKYFCVKTKYRWKVDAYPKGICRFGRGGSTLLRFISDGYSIPGFTL